MATGSVTAETSASSPTKFGKTDRWLRTGSEVCYLRLRCFVVASVAEADWLTDERLVDRVVDCGDASRV